METKHVKLTVWGHCHPDPLGERGCRPLPLHPHPNVLSLNKEGTFKGEKERFEAMARAPAQP